MHSIPKIVPTPTAKEHTMEYFCFMSYAHNTHGSLTLSTYSMKYKTEKGRHRPTRAELFDHMRAEAEKEVGGAVAPLTYSIERNAIG
jgi:hypothetical protein